MKTIIKTLIRNFYRNRVYTFINVIGLSLGIAVFMLILLFVHHELSYDKGQRKAQRICKLDIGGNFSTVPPLATVLKNQFPEIENVTRISVDNTAYILPVSKSGREMNAIKIKNVYYADSSFFNIFNYRVIEGNLQTALKEPDALVLTKSIAARLFGDRNGIGESVQYTTLFPSRQLTLKVTAILDDPPDATSMNFNGIISFSTLYGLKPNGIEVDENWRDGYCHTFLLLNENVSLKSFEDKLKAFMPKLEKEVYGIDPDSEQASQRQAGLVPLKELHFYQNHLKQLVSLMLSLALLILVIALVNYVNLSIARSSENLHEVAVKKILGASRRRLVLQYLSESVIYSLMATFCAIIFVELILPALNTIVGMKLTLNMPGNFSFILMAIFFALLTGIIAGLYPAFQLTSKSPSGFLLRREPAKESFFRYALITFQFAVSMVLISGIITITKQFNYIRNKDLGYDNKDVIYATLNHNLYSRFDAFKQELLKNPHITGVAGSQNELGQVCVTLTREVNGSERFFQELPVDPDFIKTMGLQLVKGRNFSWDRPADPYATLILSESAVKAFDLSEDQVLGTKIFMYDRPAYVIGVFRDIYFQSFHDKMDPFVLYYHPGSIGTLNIRINGHPTAGTINYITGIWNKYSPDIPMEYHFLDESYEASYRADKKFSQLILYFTVLAVFIACLGLFGLAVYSTARRTKEIGIRKVNGARIMDVILLLNMDFIKWVVLAFLLACPVAWYTSHRWLEGFAYRTSLSWWIFVMSGFTALFIALVTVSYHSWRAAGKNPVAILRYE